MKWSNFIFAVASSAATPAAGRFPLGPDAVIERYSAAYDEQRKRLYGASMEVDIEAKLPKFNKNGRLHALRHISRAGGVTYDVLEFEGDNTIKKSVIARYLSAEVQTQESDRVSREITPANYKFKYKGLSQERGRQVYVFQLTPRSKRLGLFKGELLVDSWSYLPLRESGRFVKNPSIFLKKIEFVREYEIHDGVAFPRRIQSTVQTRFFGRAEITVEFSHLSLAPAGESARCTAGRRDGDLHIFEVSGLIEGPDAHLAGTEAEVNRMERGYVLAVDGYGNRSCRGIVGELDVIPAAAG